MPEVRPMGPDDVAGAGDAWTAAISALHEAHGLPVAAPAPGAVQRRIEHLRVTDPGGSWVADDGQRIVGVAQSHVRGDLWVLAVLGVVPRHQDRHVGRTLLERALDYRPPGARGAIYSSPDPRALRRYVGAGFTLHPALSGYGPVRRVVGAEQGVREGGAADLDHVDGVDAVVRGATRRGDVTFLLGQGDSLLVDPGGGYAVTRGGRLVLLGAADEAAAVRLLRNALARCPAGVPFDVSWLTAGQQWAIRVLAEAGVALFVHGAVMADGRWPPALPYLPSGAFG